MQELTKSQNKAMLEMLDLLSKEENEVNRQLKTIVGSMVNIESQLEQMKIPDKHNRIYNSYNDLYQETNSLEALKRMIFIQWYAASEPFAFTGIAELDNNKQSYNLTALINLINTDYIDEEFKAMMVHYYSISDWYFNSYFDFESKVDLMSRNDPKFKSNSTFNNRGQMGNYWNDLLRNA